MPAKGGQALLGVGRELTALERHWGRSPRQSLPRQSVRADQINFGGQAPFARPSRRAVPSSNGRGRLSGDIQAK
jgi:hypothetical protein